jgi:DNA invertase Pin-like site-specific DNA recombinase
MRQAVSYIRVSTQRQGASGLGLEAQEAAVETFSREHSFEIVHEYREVESGRDSSRPVLAQAIAHAKKVKAVLIIAKLDRLARSVSFISNLMDSDIEFRAVDVPEANRLLLHIMAAVAENEAKAISDRTIAALAAAKARGKALGGLNPHSRNLTQEARERGAKAAGKALHAKAVEAYTEIVPIVRELKAQGLTLRAIAEELTARGYLTRKGKPWNAVQVMRLLEREA